MVCFLAFSVIQGRNKINDNCELSNSEGETARSCAVPEISILKGGGLKANAF